MQLWATTVVLLSGIAFAEPATTDRFATGAVSAKSLSKMTFSPDGILFVGDSLAARIYALDLDDKTAFTPSKPLDVPDVESKIAAMVGADPRDVLIHDMAVNPISKNIYLTVSRGKRSLASEWLLPNDVANPSVLLRVSNTGEIQEVKLSKVRHSFIDLPNPVNESADVTWKKAKMRVDAISDMNFADGKLYVAGLSNEEFSANLRIVPFPFEGAGSATTVEVFHGAHGKYETDSPIRAFLPYTINGKKYILASYLCTPLVLFEMDSLKDKKHVKGQTIAELGSGNYPLDMVAFRSQGKDSIMIVNSTRGLMRIKAEDLSKPLPSITALAAAHTGLQTEQIRGQGILQLENYGEQYLLALKRDGFTGDIKLTSLPLQRP